VRALLRFSLVLSLLVLTLLVGTLSAQGSQEKLEAAEQAYRQGRYQEATRAYEALLELGYERDGRLHYNLGNCAFRLRRYSKALLEYERALRMLGPREEIRFNRDLCLDRLGMGGRDREGLLSSLRRRLAAFGPSAWFQLGLLLEALGLLVLWFTLRRSTWPRLLATLILLLLGGLAQYRSLQNPDDSIQGIVVLEDRTPLRSEPRKDLDPILLLPSGQRAHYLEGSASWVKIRVSTQKGEKTGWVQKPRIGLY
jgi:tetratricopeptide (TPR) repeat protein